MTGKHAANGLVKVRGPGEAPAAGIHLCQFYWDADELFEYLGKYFQGGLNLGELCVWILPEKLTPEIAAEEMRERVAGWDAFVAKGSMQIGACRDCYTDMTGAMRPGNEILAEFDKKARQSLADGYTGMRAAGDTSWCGRLPDLGPYLDYEIDVTRMLRGRRILGLCSYSLQECAESRLSSILEVHHQAYLKLGSQWQAFADPERARAELTWLVREINS